METLDHRETASFARGFEPNAYRSTQKGLVQNGRFEDAVRLDIWDIRHISKHKYNLGVNQMLDYLEKLN